LAATLLRYLGVDAILLGAAVDGDQLNHMAVGVAGAETFSDTPGAAFYRDPSTGRTYYYCEATPVTGSTTRDNPDWEWHIGDVPFDDMSRLKPIYLRGVIVQDE